MATSQDVDLSSGDTPDPFTGAGITSTLSPGHESSSAQAYRSSPPLVHTYHPPVTMSSSPSDSRPVPPSISILEKLIKTCPVWLQLGIPEDRASLILQNETPGAFLVRKSGSLKRMVLSVRLSDSEGDPRVSDLLVREEKPMIYLEGSVLVFDNIFKLIAFYCVSRDILPFTLRLPQVIVQATRYEDVEMISSLGLDFWGSSLNRHMENSGLCHEGQDVQSPPLHRNSHDSCETDASAGNRRLWYVSPVLLEEHCNSLPTAIPIARSLSLTTPGLDQPGYRRPPPLPPSPHFSAGLLLGAEWEEDGAADPQVFLPSHPPQAVRVRAKEEGSYSSWVEPAFRSASDRPAGASRPLQSSLSSPEYQLLTPRSTSFPQHSPFTGTCFKEPVTMEEYVAGSKGEEPTYPALPCSEKTAATEKPSAKEVWILHEGTTEPAMTDSTVGSGAPATVKTTPPVPPPRVKKLSKSIPQTHSVKVEEPQGKVPGSRAAEKILSPTLGSSVPVHPSIFLTSLKGSNDSLDSPEGSMPSLDQDHHSNSSTEEEAEPASSPLMPLRRTPTIMLEKAKNRLSMINLSYMLTGFMYGERKLRNRIVELTCDRDSYFGNLVRDYRAFTLESIQKHSSSTDMLQEIRQMITQLKSYLVQSVELKRLLESAIYSEEKLEATIEAALCKSLLKPIRGSVYSSLRDIHTRDDSLRRLQENQQVVLRTTSTDLGVTTSVPEAPDIEKIQYRLSALHKDYSPERMISLLLKICKIIYEAMSVGCRGRALGADDFLPVLMYVLARCNVTALLLDVEYMMELMDPALQLGEGFYYLTTAYGALEHMKDYDKLPMTRQLSLEVQDSIHLWERRRTLNREIVSRSSVQDFVKVSYMEAGGNTRTLGIGPDTTTQDLCAQCASKFKVTEAGSYRMYVLAAGQERPLAPEELLLSILHQNKKHRVYSFIYRLCSFEQEASSAPSPQTGGQGPGNQHE